MHNNHFIILQQKELVAHALTCSLQRNDSNMFLSRSCKWCCYMSSPYSLVSLVLTLLPVDPTQTTFDYALWCNTALQEKRIRGAGLDVTCTEPLPKESPLWDLENVLLSPHTADRTTTFQAEAIQQFTDLAKLYVQGKELYNVVDKEIGY